jgi:magnesium chelatase accessory protein
VSGPDWRLEGRDWPHHDHSRFVEAGEVRWHVQSLGVGPPLLLVHGTGASTHSFREVMPLLAASHAVVAIDLPGHGFSTTREGYVPSLQRVSASIGALLKALTLEPTVAVGHSAGAAIVTEMTLTGAITPTHLVSLAGAFVPFGGLGTSLFLPAARLLAQAPLAARVLAFRARDHASVERLVRSTGSVLDP